MKSNGGIHCVRSTMVIWQVMYTGGGHEKNIMKTLTLKTKPIPVNQRNTVIRGKVFLSKIYRETKEALQWEVQSQHKGEPQEGDVTLNIMFYYGDKRKRDIDAYLKILLDAMSGIVYGDDSQVTEMHLFKEVDIANPRTVIQVL